MRLIDAVKDEIGEDEEVIISHFCAQDYFALEDIKHIYCGCDACELCWTQERKGKP